MSNDLMEPRVAQVYETLTDETSLSSENCMRVAMKIVELLDRQAEKLAEMGA